MPVVDDMPAPKNYVDALAARVAALEAALSSVRCARAGHRSGDHQRRSGHGDLHHQHPDWSCQCLGQVRRRAARSDVEPSCRDHVDRDARAGHRAGSTIGADHAAPGAPDGLDRRRACALRRDRSRWATPCSMRASIPYRARAARSRAWRSRRRRRSPRRTPARQGCSLSEPHPHQQRVTTPATTRPGVGDRRHLRRIRGEHHDRHRPPAALPSLPGEPRTHRGPRLDRAARAV